MFKSGLKLYVYPMIDEKTGKTGDRDETGGRAESAVALSIPDRQPIHRGDHRLQSKDYLRIYPPDVLAKLQAGRRRRGSEWCRRKSRRSSKSANSSAIGRRESAVSARFRGRLTPEARTQKARSAGTFPATGVFTHHGADAEILSLASILGKHAFKGVALRRKSDSRFVLTSFASREVPEELRRRTELGSRTETAAAGARRQRQRLRPRHFRSGGSFAHHRATGHAG